MSWLKVRSAKDAKATSLTSSFQLAGVSAAVDEQRRLDQKPVDFLQEEKNNINCDEWVQFYTDNSATLIVNASAARDNY